MPSSSEKKLKPPFGLTALKGVDVSKIVKGRSLVDCCSTNQRWKPAESDIDPLFLENMTRMLNERLHLKMEREKAQRKELERWIKEEQMTRYVKREHEKMVAEQEQRRLEELCAQQLNAQRQQIINCLNTPRVTIVVPYELYDWGKVPELYGTFWNL